VLITISLIGIDTLLMRSMKLDAPLNQPPLPPVSVVVGALGYI